MKNLLKLIVITLSFTVFPNDLLSIYEEALDKDPEFNSKKADLAISKEFLNILKIVKEFQRNFIEFQILNGISKDFK